MRREQAEPIPSALDGYNDDDESESHQGNMSQDFGSDELSKAWDEKTDVIRAFIEARPQYEQLCNEIEYILKKRMNGSSVEYSAITSRAKTLKSFAEKLSRKEYDDPLGKVTDLAGVRVVYLYKSDRHAIEKIIQSEFDIIERVDKVEEQEADRLVTVPFTI